MMIEFSRRTPIVRVISADDEAAIADGYAKLGRADAYADVLREVTHMERLTKDAVVHLLLRRLHPNVDIKMGDPYS